MLKLAQLTEAAKHNIGEMDLDVAQPQTPHHMQQSSQSSGSSSDSTSLAQSPSSPARYSRSSAASSVASSPAYRESMDGYSAAKRPLTDVKEEPQREEDSHQVFSDYLFGPDLDILRHNTYVESPARWESKSEPHFPDNIFSDSGLIFTDSSLVTSQAAKKQRSGDYPLSGVTSRIGTRFPSLTRKLKSRSRVESGLTLDLLEETIGSRTSSASSTILSPVSSIKSKHDSHLPPSPARTVFEESLRDSGVYPIDIAKANEHSEDENEEGLARTPLLPPLVVDFPAHLKDSPVNSPLPSPTVAEASTASIIHTPLDTPRLPGLPSPPLSSRPSMTSLHHSRGLQGLSQLDVPPIAMTDPDNEWSQKLGHANFNIHPEPYVPEIADVESFKQLRANWNLARCNYTKHLVRIGEHYGATSKTYKLTEQKWAEVDAQWKQCNKMILSCLDETTEEVMELSQSSAAPATPIRVPPMNDPQGKFPELGDEDIVGPMTVGPVIKLPSPSQSRPSKKRTFLKFLQDFKTNTSHLLGRNSVH